MDNSNICEICKEPATYGDGLTWARCSKHQYEHLRDHPEEQEVKAQEDKPLPHEGFPHETIEGLTSIIIPIYNTTYPLFHMTGNCIGSIHEHTKLPYEIIIIDNGSPIKIEKLDTYNVNKVIVNEENLGYVKAINKGIRASFGEYICLMTNDVQVFDYWLEDAQEALKYLDLVAATPMYGEPYSRCREALAKREEWMQKPIEDSFSDFKDGACIITTKVLFDEIGLLDEGFFNYAADTDLFRRCEKADKKYATSKRINIHHIIQATGAGIAENPDLMNKDKEYYRKKWEDGQGLAS